MKTIKILERDMTDPEFSQMNEGFKEYELLHTEVNQTSDRLGFVILDGNKFVGCSSGLAYKNGEKYNNWCYLSDLFIEKEYRGQGLGKEVLKKLEEKLMDGISRNIQEQFEKGIELLNTQIGKNTLKTSKKIQEQIEKGIDIGLGESDIPILSSRLVFAGRTPEK